MVRRGQIHRFDPGREHLVCASQIRACEIVELGAALRQRREEERGPMLLVLSVLTISYASSLKAYFQQHSQIQQLRGQIAASETSIAHLQSPCT